MRYSTKVIYCRTTKQWVLLDEDGYRIAGFDRPSLARKAKLYWWLYLTQDQDHMKYLDWMQELHNQ
jgi:hypothetical protein